MTYEYDITYIYPFPAPAAMSEDGENHYLAPYLGVRLPELGLDFDTYGPYCYGIDPTDADELDSIIDLLRSSSETHSDDDAAWEEVRSKILGLAEEERDRAAGDRRSEIERARQAEEDKAKEARRVAEEHAAELERTKEERARAEEEKRKAREDLMSRYGYEGEEGGEDGGGKGGGDDAGEGGPVNNREAAVQAQKEHTKKVREESGKSTESKKVAREKTKDAKKLKPFQSLQTGGSSSSAGPID